jgi:hypothetical protein
MIVALMLAALWLPASQYRLEESLEAICCQSSSCANDPSAPGTARDCSCATSGQCLPGDAKARRDAPVEIHACALASAAWALRTSAVAFAIITAPPEYLASCHFSLRQALSPRAPAPAS